MEKTVTNSEAGKLQKSKEANQQYKHFENRFNKKL